MLSQMNKPQTDREWIDAMDDEAIDLSDIPELMPEMFAKEVAKHSLKGTANKAQLTIRVDQDVLAWFNSRGVWELNAYQCILRAYLEANLSHKKQPQQRVQR